MSEGLCKSQIRLQRRGRAILQSCRQNLEDSILEVQNALLEHQQGRILYPRFYTFVGSLNQYDIDDANAALQEGCACNDISVARVLIYGNESQSDRIMNRLKSLGSSCLESMFDTLNSEEFSRFGIDDFVIPDSCQSQKNHPVCKKLHDDAKVIRRRLLSLASSVRPETAASFEACLDNQDSNSLNGNISDFLSDLKNHLTCSDYAVGEERQLRGINPFLGERYLVKRKSKNHYVASVAVRFTSLDSYEHGNEYGETSQKSSQAYDHHIHTHYMKKAQECIKEANTKMLGPNGEKLEIVLKDANEANACEYQHNISITNPEEVGYGASYDQYPSDIDSCSLMTHEILHIFGLNDEYSKNINRKAIPYPIPNDLNPSTNNILLLKTTGIEDREKDECGGEIVQYNSIMANLHDRWDNSWFGRDKSLLDPAHFEAILYGNCMDREGIRLYNQCYRTEVTSSTQEESCSIKRNNTEECRRANVLGRSRQRELSIIRNELSTNLSGYRNAHNKIRVKSKTPIVVEESAYDSVRQNLLERLEAVRNWPE